MIQNKMASSGKFDEKREAMVKEAIEQGLVMIPEYKFEHAVYMITESKLSEEGLTFGYNKCAGFLRLKQRPDVGVTVIVSPKWMFVGVLTNAYTTNSNGCPVFLDGFSFSGLVSLQVVEKTWPATAGLEDNEFTVMEAIQKSTFIESVTEAGDDLISDVDVELGGSASASKHGQSRRSERD